jgi:hypothetical protein
MMEPLAEKLRDWIKSLSHGNEEEEEPKRIFK